MKKIITLSSLLLGVVFLAGCGQQSVSQTQLTTPAPIAQKSTQPIGGVNLANTFTDETIGFEIKYPIDWIGGKKIEDKENKLSSVLFGTEDASATVYIKKYEGVDPNKFDGYVQATKKEMSTDGGRIYDEKDFVYTLADGSTSIGKQFSIENSNMKTDGKGWFAALSYGKSLITLMYTGKDENYTSNLNIAKSMLDSLKITK